MSDFLLVPSDEFVHPAGNDLTFNESFYVNGWDHATGVGGWMRLGNRINEGHAELSLCLYLPDGRIACQFARPPLTSHQRFSSAGLTLEVQKPFAHATAQYRGEVMVVEDPSLLRDPKRLYESAPRVDCQLDWQLETISPVHGGLPTSPTQPTMYGRDFSLGHFNQHTHVRGALTVGAQHFAIDGTGWRDHSWGPRTWQAIHFYRLFIGCFGDDQGFMILKITDRSGQTRRLGVWLADGKYEALEDLDLLIDWTEQKDPRAVTLAVRTAGRRVIVEGHVRTLAPLRNRRDVNGVTVTSRIAEGFTEFTANGRRGWGITEFIEVLEAGQPVGYPL